MTARHHKPASADGDRESRVDEASAAGLPIESLQQEQGASGSFVEPPLAIGDRVADENGDLTSVVIENNVIEYAVAEDCPVKAHVLITEFLPDGFHISGNTFLAFESIA
ncbi:hypothetical protein FPZ24_08265 [Sphingomonas panacisoli]|uniref:Uncharacterized protein n=1 Tax=Sphingomonas panacisoli TaxID=1813879 RepID=A0A5B8LGW0_9SPHN|nr:hypothetical protein [Sphingomonas panacisoli]QDZ07477.1 hypothetical protein FPZ24_08265 [Sphingomonas panacisoli]